jgi:hypothetical protein
MYVPAGQSFQREHSLALLPLLNVPPAQPEQA